MHASLKAKLYGAGITSPDMLRHAIDHATCAAEGQRLTKSMRVNRPMRRAMKVAAVLAIAFLLIAAR